MTSIKTIRWAFVLFLLAAIGIGSYLTNHGSYLRTHLTPRGIVDFELTPSAAEHQAIVSQWQQLQAPQRPTKRKFSVAELREPKKEKQLTALAQEDIYIDFGFILTYTAAFVLAWCVVLHNVTSDSIWRQACLPAIYCLGAAAALDLLENVCMLLLLDRSFGDWLSMLCSFSAYLKFLLLGFCGPAGVFLAIREDPEIRFLYSRTVRPAFEAIARYPLVIFLVAVLWYATGYSQIYAPGFGIQYLFWGVDEMGVIQEFLVGASIGVVVFYVVFVSLLLMGGDPWMAPNDDQRRDRYRWIFIAGGAVLLLSIVWRGFSPRPWDIAVIDGKQDRGSYLVAAASIFAFFSLLACIEVVKRWNVGNWIEKHTHPLVSKYFKTLTITKSGDERVKDLHEVAAVMFTALSPLMVLFFLLAKLPAVGVCLLIAFAVAIYGRLHYMFPVRHFGWAALGFVLMLGLIGTSNHQYQFKDYRSLYSLDKLKPLVSQGEASDPEEDSDLIDDQDYLEDWLERQGPDNRKLILIAAQGGGIKAGYWSALVLKHLELNNPDFLSRVRIVAGSSGGMLGAAHYVGSISKPPGADAQPEEAKAYAESREEELNEVVEAAGRDGLSEALRGLILRDLPLLGHFPLDRGEQMQRAWQGGHTNRTGVGQTFKDLLLGEKEGWRPSLVFSPMMVEDGRQLLISNLNLKQMTLRHAHFAAHDSSSEQSKDESVSPAVQLFQCIPEAQGRTRLSTAVRMTASFPYITPESTLPTVPSRRIVDSGFFDDYGIVVTTKWIESHWEDLAGVDIALVKISVTDIEKAKLITNREADPANASVNALSFLSTPIEAVAAARSSTMNFRNEGDIARLQQSIDPTTTIGPRSLQVFEFELPVPVSLSWRLTDFEKKQLRYAIDDSYGPEFEAIGFDLGYMTEWSMPSLSAKEYALFAQHFELLRQGRQNNQQTLNEFQTFLQGTENVD